MLALIKTSIGTKFVSRWSDMMCKLALQAIRTVARDENGAKTIDIKRYAKVEKVPGGEIEDSVVLDGVMVNKDVTHPKMRRRIENPRIILLDCPLEYKKGESQTNIEISNTEDWNRILEIEEEQIKAMCEKIIEFKPDLVFTEKGVSGQSYHIFLCTPLILPFIYRPRSALPPQGRPSDQCHPPSPQVRQQPNRTSMRSDHRQPSRRPP
jgi:T-complex protein 1 subunit gamma